MKMKKKKLSKEAMLKEAEFLANRITDIFEDVYPEEGKRKRENIGKVEGVICYILGEEGYFRYNSKVIEANKLSMVLFQDSERMKAYATLSLLTGKIDFRSEK